MSILLDYQLAKNAATIPEKPAIIYHDTVITYSELEKLTNRLANCLLSEGIGKGDCVGLLLNKRPEALISFLAIVKIGAIVTPLNYKFTKYEMEYVLKLTTPKLIIANCEHLINYIDLIYSCLPKVKLLLVNTDQCEKFISKRVNVFSLENKKENENYSIPPKLPAPVTPDDVVYLNFTSGTTGLPKAAMTTQRNLFWNTRSSVEALDLTPDDIHLCLFPIYGHPHEIICRPLYLGGTLVLEDRLLPKYIAQSISKYRVTALMAAPVFIEMLILETENREYDLSSLTILEAGGMHTTDGLASRVSSYLPGSFLPVWGSTETTGIAIANRRNLYRPAGSVGKVCPYYEVKIVDENGKPCPPDEVGIMLVRGPAVVKGYFNSPEETKKMFTEDGWYKTEDLMKVDKEGYYYFQSRKSGMIKVAGMKVYPTEVENVLSLHPKIAYSVVLPYADKIRGEIPVAIVSLKAGEMVTEQEIRKFCREYLSDYKIPRIIKIWPELPKTASGKIDLKKIKELIANDLTEEEKLF